MEEFQVVGRKKKGEGFLKRGEGAAR